MYVCMYVCMYARVTQQSPHIAGSELPNITENLDNRGPKGVSEQYTACRVQHIELDAVTGQADGTHRHGTPCSQSS
jgi:hypothetical protein